MSDRWYEVREVWTGLSGGLRFDEALDYSVDKADAIARARHYLRESDRVAYDMGSDSMVGQGYDRVTIEVWKMDGDKRVSRVWAQSKDYDDD